MLGERWMEKVAKKYVVGRWEESVLNKWGNPEKSVKKTENWHILRKEEQSLFPRHISTFCGCHSLYIISVFSLCTFLNSHSIESWIPSILVHFYPNPEYHQKVCPNPQSHQIIRLNSDLPTRPKNGPNPESHNSKWTHSPYVNPPPHCICKSTAPTLPCLIIPPPRNQCFWNFWSKMPKFWPKFLIFSRKKLVSSEFANVNTF